MKLASVPELIKLEVEPQVSGNRLNHGAYEAIAAATGSMETVAPYPEKGVIAADCTAPPQIAMHHAWSTPTFRFVNTLLSLLTAGRAPGCCQMSVHYTLQEEVTAGAVSL